MDRKRVFRPKRLGIDARTQVLVALLRYSLREGMAEPLEAESLALTLVRRVARAADREGARSKLRPQAVGGPGKARACQ